MTGPQGQMFPQGQQGPQATPLSPQHYGFHRMPQRPPQHMGPGPPPPPHMQQRFVGPPGAHPRPPGGAMVSPAGGPMAVPAGPGGQPTLQHQVRHPIGPGAVAGAAGMPGHPQVQRVQFFGHDPSTKRKIFFCVCLCHWFD